MYTQSSPKRHFPPSPSAGSIRSVLVHTPPKYHIIFFSILFGAVLMRLLFYLGPSGADDMIYFSVIRKLLLQENIATAITSAQHWGIRIGMIFPLWGIFKIFGVSEASSMIYPMLLSICTLTLIYLSGALIFSAPTALFAVFTYAILPLDTYYAGVMYPDGPVVFFSAAFLFLLYRLTTHTKVNIAQSLAAGIILGLGYYIRETSILLFIALPILFFRAENKINYCKSAVLIGIGFALMLSLEMIVLWVLTDDPFTRFKILTEKTQVLTPNKYAFVPRFHSYFWDGIILLFATYWIAPLMLPLTMGLFPFSLSVFKNHSLPTEDKKKLLWISILSLSILLFFIYAPIIGFTKPLERDERYYLIVMPLFSLLFGYLLNHLITNRGGIFQGAGYSLLALNVLFSLFALGCIVNKNSHGIDAIDHFIKENPAAAYSIPAHLVPILQLRNGLHYADGKIVSYFYEDTPASIFSKLEGRGKKYLLYLPEVNEDQTKLTKYLQRPNTRFSLAKTLHTSPSLSCRLLQKGKFLAARVPQFFMERICYAPEIQVYAVKNHISNQPL